jgi:hypothetical protein
MRLMQGRYCSCALVHLFALLAAVFYEAKQGGLRTISTGGIAQFQGSFA